jgi:hypothetical protein
MNSISFNTNFTRLLLFKIALIVSISTAVAGGSSVELNRFTEVDTQKHIQLNKSWYIHYQRVHSCLQHQVNLLVVVILRFIQMGMPLLPLSKICIERY